MISFINDCQFYLIQIQKIEKKFISQIYFLMSFSQNQIITFQQILTTSPIIQQFFYTHAKTSSETIKLASSLILQSINKKLSKLPEQSHKNHYNVAYIKHNRFLSPNQKKQVAPKVTEVIPVSPQKIIIYGKPKVKLDQGYGCPLHQQNCEQFQEQSIHYQQQKFANQNRYHQQKNNSDTQNDQECDLPKQYQEYLSPKNKLKKKQNKKRKIDANQTIGTICSPNSKKRNSVSNQMTSPKSFVNQNESYRNGNHQLCHQNYSNVESKIKQLIQRDKKNRQMQKQIEKQKVQIQDIYERQNRLLMMQKYQRQIIQQGNDEQNGIQNQTWKITMSQNPNRVQAKSSTSSEGQSESSEVNLHGHKDKNSRVKCYQCQLQRLKKRKIKAQAAIQQINKQEAKRNKMLDQIMSSEVYKNQKSGFSRPSNRTHNSIMLSSQDAM